MSVVKLVVPDQPEKNEQLILVLKEMLAQAECGDIQAFAGVKFTPDKQFMTIKIGDMSDLEVLGALSFISYDIIQGNQPTEKR